MGLFDDLNKNFYYTKKFTYEDIVNLFKEFLAKWEQNDTKSVYFRNRKTN